MFISNTATCSMYELRDNGGAGFAFCLKQMTAGAYARFSFIIDEEKTRKMKSQHAVPEIYGWNITTIIAENRSGGNFHCVDDGRHRVIYANVLEYIDTNRDDDVTLLEKYYGFEFLTRWPSNDRRHCDIRCVMLKNWQDARCLSMDRLDAISNAMRKDAISHDELRARYGLCSWAEQQGKDLARAKTGAGRRAAGGAPPSPWTAVHVQLLR